MLLQKELQPIGCCLLVGRPVADWPCECLFLSFVKACFSHRSQVGTKRGLVCPNVHSNCLAIWNAPLERTATHFERLSLLVGRPVADRPCEWWPSLAAIICLPRPRRPFLWLLQDTHASNWADSVNIGLWIFKFVRYVRACPCPFVYPVFIQILSK